MNINEIMLITSESGINKRTNILKLRYYSRVNPQLSNSKNFPSTIVYIHCFYYTFLSQFSTTDADKFISSTFRVACVTGVSD